MKKHLLIFLLLVNCCASQAMAQTRTITGTVTSAADNLTIPGATVRIKGTTTAVSTDSNGKYSINAATGQVLVYSFIGNTTAERTVGNQSVIDVILQTDVRSLQEVSITTGFGVKQDKRDLTSSVQVIKGSAVQATQRENFVTALAGRVAGANHYQHKRPTGCFRIYCIAWYHFYWASNQPLFVIDGIRVNNEALSQSALASNGDNRRQDFTNRIADINPDDIETITVLKGADAAAVYGSDAAGGAIVITTKKGTSGNGALTYDNNFSFAKAYRFPKVQNVFGPGSLGNLDPWLGQPLALPMPRYYNI
jgi:TonB-dependent SusC/RagA subfamily outer membrane receptor